MRKTMAGVLLALLVLPVLAVPAEAAEDTGSIQVTMRSGEIPMTGGTVTLFRVGDRTEDGYRVVDDFGGGMVHFEDAMSPHLAQWLSQQIGGAGMTRIVDEKGGAFFGELTEGMYLFIQNETIEDFFPVMPFLVTVPYENQWDVEVYPLVQQVMAKPAEPGMDSPNTGQHPAPFLGAIGMVASGIGLAVCVGRKRKK